MALHTAKKASRGSRIWQFALPIYLISALIILGPALLNVTVRFLTGLALDQGRPDLAEKCIAVLIPLSPRSALLYDALGYTQYAQGKSSAALASFQLAQDQDISYAANQNNLGVALLDQGEASQAVDHLQSAVKLEPGNAGIYYNLANALYSSKNHGEASNAYRLAFELDASQIDAQSAWAAIALQDGQIEQARQVWHQVLTADPNHALSRRGLGVISTLEGDPAGALVELQKAEEMDPFDPVTRFYAGLAFEMVGNLTQAKAEFERAVFLGVDPTLVSQANAHLQALRSKQETPMPEP